jgi:hypothetical protein
MGADSKLSFRIHATVVLPWSASRIPKTGVKVTHSIWSGKAVAAAVTVAGAVMGTEAAAMDTEATGTATVGLTTIMVTGGAPVRTGTLSLSRVLRTTDAANTAKQMSGDQSAWYASSAVQHADKTRPGAMTHAVFGSIAAAVPISKWAAEVFRPVPATLTVCA